LEERTVRGRFVLLHDIEDNWQSKTTFIPRKGEPVIYDIDDNYDYERIKIGDGVRDVNSLPFSDNSVMSLIEKLENDKLDSSALPTTVDDALSQAKASGQFDGEDGVTFTPVVSGKGDLSWTNNGGLPNPTPVNILGFVYKGSNPLEAVGLEQDTRQFWAGKGSGYWWISGYNNLKEQPSQYGYLLNMCYGTGETYQVFFGAALNIICVRSGGAGSARDDGWYRANSSTEVIWRELVFADTLTPSTENEVVPS